MVQGQEDLLQALKYKHLNFIVLGFSQENYPSTFKQVKGMQPLCIALIAYGEFNKLTTSGTTSHRQVVSWESLENFDDISVVYKSTNHGKLLLICFLAITLTLWRPFPLKFPGKSRAQKREQQTAPPSYHFHAQTLINHLALDQSVCEKSFSYGKNTCWGP